MASRSIITIRKTHCSWFIHAQFFFFFNDTATTEIYTLSLHDALPISRCNAHDPPPRPRPSRNLSRELDRKSTRLNSSHQIISYAVFCLKKKKKNTRRDKKLMLQYYIKQRCGRRSLPL